MDLDQFKIILNQLQDINYRGRMSYHFYGEPLLHPKLIEFVTLTKTILPDVRPEIFSNGTYLTKEKFHSLKAAGVQKFTVTKHKGFETIAFDETFLSLSDEDKKMVKYYTHEQLTFTSRGGLVDAGKKIEEPLKKMCLIPQCSLIITKDGNVLSCYEDYQEKNTMGNIFEEHIKDIWNKPIYVKQREDLKKGLRHLYEVCKSCNNMQVIQ